MGRDPSVGLVAGFGGGLYLYWYGLGLFHLKKMIEYTPTSKSISVTPGLCEIYGSATRMDESFSAPYSEQECLFYMTRLYKWSGSGKSRRRNLVTELKSSAPIYLSDSTGYVLVVPSFDLKSNKTRIRIKKDFTAKKRLGASWYGKMLGSQGTSEPSQLRTFVTKHSPDLLTYSDDLEVEEIIICEGDRLFVIGTAEVYRPLADGTNMLIRYNKKTGVFCVAEDGEEPVLGTIGRDAALSLLGGPAIAWTCFSVLMEHWGFSNHMSVSIFMASAMYVFVLIMLLLEMYNGLVRLRVNIERAKANVQTLLLRRSTLIPQLVEVVKGLASYEQDLQEKLAHLRAEKSSLESTQFVALKEQYPELIADKSFLKLQEELSSTEDRIASSREFVNDSVKLYNQRRESFPYILFAGWCGLEREGFLQT